MKLERVPGVSGETILRGVTDSGLVLMVNVRPDYVKTFAALGVNVGSVDRMGEGQVVPAGLAHFLEHEMFKDDGGDVSDRFASWGADSNAMTGFSNTTYVVSTVEEPAASLDLLLDFVQEPSFADDRVAQERGIIAQEIRMYDDDPEWRLFFGLLGCLYAKHPVRENIAGSVESIGDIDAATLQRCYDLFYHPSNMCLGVAGPMDPDEVAGIVERDQAGRGLDGRERHRRILERANGEPVGVVSPAYSERLSVSRPRWILGIKESVLGGAPLEMTRRELTTRILLDLVFGRSSPAFESLYGEGLIDESFHLSHTAESTFAFSTISSDTGEPDRLEARVREHLARAASEGLDAGRFERTRHKLYGSLLRGLDSLETSAFSMVSGTFRGTTPFQALELVDTIGMDDLQQRLEEHVRDDALATATVLPQDGP